jgi:hypothetical protein
MVLGGLAVALVALLALGITALGADHAAARLTSSGAAASARRSDQYYSCLEAQAHSLIGPHDVVYLPEPTLSQWVTVTSVIGGWADVTLHLHAANTALELQRSSQGGTCDGQVLVAVHQLAHGRVLITRGLQAHR